LANAYLHHLAVILLIVWKVIWDLGSTRGNMWKAKDTMALRTSCCHLGGTAIASHSHHECSKAPGRLSPM
jgi:hypothetical protein